MFTYLVQVVLWELQPEEGTNTARFQSLEKNIMFGYYVLVFNPYSAVLFSLLHRRVLRVRSPSFLYIKLFYSSRCPPFLVVIYSYHAFRYVSFGVERAHHAVVLGGWGFELKHCS